MHKYRLTYNAVPHPEGINKEQIPEGHGACDAIVFGSLIFEEEGLSLGSSTHDGRTGGGLSPDDLFKYWVFLAHELADRLPDGGRKDICKFAFETVQAVIQARGGPS